MRRLALIGALLLALFALSVTLAAAQGQTIHVVQRGETLYTIALRYNSTITAIAQANAISNPNIIYVGQQLVIPTSQQPPAPPPTGVPPTTPPGGQTIHTVVRGEYLATIARRYGVSVTAIIQANNLANPNLIFAGQRLIIPLGGTTPPPTGVPPTGVPPTAPPTGGTYTVQRGDTLNSIARRFGTTVQAIAQANGIANPNLIYPGQVLQIPGATGPAPTPPPGGPPPATIAPGPGPTGGFELGGHVFSFAYPDQMRGAGMTWAKIQIRWNGTDGPGIAQGAIDAARSRGFRILLGIVGDPGQLGANPSQYYQNFANFLGGVAALGPDGIEVWNEQNIDREWPRGQISPAGYTQMLSLAYQAIKRANPNVLVISGAPAPTGFFGGACTGNGCDDNAFIRGMAQAGAASYADCIGIHYNEGILPPDATSGDPRGNSSHYTRYFPSMVNLYASVFPNKPLCFTEIGYLSPEGFGPLPPDFAWAANTSVQEQAEWLARAVTLARQSGRVRLFIVWNVDNTNYGADPQAGFAIVRANQCLACITLGAAMGVR
jgi:LysM repeat protein